MVILLALRVLIILRMRLLILLIVIKSMKILMLREQRERMVVLVNALILRKGPDAMRQIMICRSVQDQRSLHPHATHSARSVFNALNDAEIFSSDIQCLQRKVNGEVAITFSAAAVKERFLALNSLRMDFRNSGYRSPSDIFNSV